MLAQELQGSLTEPHLTAQAKPLTATSAQSARHGTKVPAVFLLRVFVLQGEAFQGGCDVISVVSKAK